MNWKQAVISICAIVVAAVIVWRDLPIEFPGMILRALLLFVKVSVVLGLAVVAYIFMADKKKPS